MTAGTLPVELEGYYIEPTMDGDMWLHHVCGWGMELTTEEIRGKTVDYGVRLATIVSASMRHQLTHTEAPR